MAPNLSQNSPWTSELEGLKHRGLYRAMPALSGIPGRVAGIDGREVLNFSSNNYLGLAGHPQLMQAAAECSLRHGAGSTASRLIAGNGEIHRAVEDFVAQWKGTEAAVVFGSGYQANVGILSSLTTEDDLIISDKLNHASIIDGSRLSRAHVRIYGHFDLQQLEDLLKMDGYRRKLVVTESVFSMDGDRAPLQEIDGLCRRWGALLMVDEAHAAGVIGPQGRGAANEQGIVPEIQMGTLGKAVGAAGAYVAGTRPLIDLLINRARSFIYTTAASPCVLGSALAGLKIIASPEGDMRRERLRNNAEEFHRLLSEAGFPVALPGHIAPVHIGESRRTMEVSARCLQGGVFAHGIRYPTVPEGTARIRFTLMSDHTSEDLRTAVSTLNAALR
jgi:8-amino-7-oxononanoate synthase